MAPRPNPAAATPLVDEDLAYRILRLANLLAKPFHERYGARYDLSLAEWRIMMALAAHPKATATALADRTGMHIMNVSRSVARLVRMGRVLRETDRADRRRAVLRLSSKGRSIFQRIAPGAQARELAVRSALNAREAAALRHTLDTLIDRLRTESTGGKPRRPPRSRA